MPKLDWDAIQPDADIEPPQDIEYLAEPRLRTCPMCAGCGTSNGTTCVGCVGEGVLLPPYARFDKETVHRGMVAKWTKSPWVVTVDDVPYAGFGTKDDAIGAVKLWLGYTDGLGRIVDTRERCHWPAAEGRVLRVVRNENAL